MASANIDKSSDVLNFPDYSLPILFCGTCPVSELTSGGTGKASTALVIFVASADSTWLPFTHLQTPAQSHRAVDLFILFIIASFTIAACAACKPCTANIVQLSETVMHQAVL